MKFDVVIGNPPYQEDKKDTSDRPVYNEFMTASYQISRVAELITPARFLFNAGKTPKEWNDKMLNDAHFKVIKYVADGKSVFPNTEIKGGVTIHLYNKEKKFTPIKTFTPYTELNEILNKVSSIEDSYIDEFVYSESSYRYSDKFAKENPYIRDVLKKSSQSFISSNAFALLPDIFMESKKYNTDIEIIGRYENQRVSRYINHDYLEFPNNFNKFKVFLPKSNGSGILGEILSNPFVANPSVGHTQTFISIGSFNSKNEANSCLKYLKGKFSRIMLGVLKITQDNKKNVWKYVPLQDFTSKSDINWSKSIHEIDLQLYKKYGLDDNEIKFIETHVKEMA